jgi:hypothetical protein
MSDRQVVMTFMGDRRRRMERLSNSVHPLISDPLDWSAELNKVTLPAR